MAVGRQRRRPDVQPPRAARPHARRPRRPGRPRRRARGDRRLRRVDRRHRRVARLGRRSGPGGRLLARPTPGRPPPATTASSTATAPLVLFLDDDVVPAPDLVATHVRHHQTLDDDLVVVGPMRTPADVDALAVGAVGAEHALQAVRRHGRGATGRPRPAVLHGQRIAGPPPPRRRPAGSIPRSAGPRTSSWPTGWPTPGSRSRSLPMPS